MHATMASVSSNKRHDIFGKPILIGTDPDADTYEFSFGWSVSCEYVTREIAKVILETQNEHNRKYLRKSHIEKLTKEIDADQFLMTPEGLIFDKDENLIDGQHRLYALLASGKPGLMMIVWRNVSQVVFEKLNGHVPRSFGDRNKTTRDVQDVVNQVARIFYGNSHSHTENKIVLEAFGSDIDWLYTVPYTKRNKVTQAPVRAAVVMRKVKDPVHADWLIAQYRALMTLSYNDMDSSIQSLCRQITVDGIRSWDLLVRAWRSFDYSKRANTKIQVRENADDYIQMRKVIGKRLGVDA